MAVYADVAKKLDTHIREMANVDANSPDLNDDTHIFDYGFVDSFGAVALVEFVERTFSIKVTDKDLVTRPLNTIREIATLVLERQAESKPS